MSATLRLPCQLYEKMIADLVRPHPFAHERVGIVYTRLSDAGAGHMLVFPVDYAPVPDGDYIHSASRAVGAEISAVAIRRTMQHILDSGEGAFHVHLHAHQGRPRFSPVDERSLPGLVRSFGHAGPQAAHGALLFSEDAAIALVQLPYQADPAAARISIVGFPLRIYEG